MKQDAYEARAVFNDSSFLDTHFRLGPFHIVKDLGGTYNLNLLLEANGADYVLRLHRPWVTYERLSQLHQAKYILAHAGFPVPLPLSTRSGETILSYDGRLLEIEPFIAHEGGADTWERNIAAFSLLGKLHAFLATEMTNIQLTDPIVSNYGTPETLLNWIQQAAQAIAQSIDIDVLQMRQALYLYTEAIQILSSLQIKWNEVKGHLLHHLTHGDYGGGNLLFRQEHPVAILDFDFLRVRERVFELAYTLYWWGWQQGQEAITSISFWKRAKELLASYNTATLMQLTLEEMRVLPLEMARVPLYWIAETYFLPHPGQEVIKQAGKIKHARWIFAHSEQLADLFAETEG